MMPEIESKISKYDNDLIFSPDAAWWIGFCYRLLCLAYGLLSKQIKKMLPFDVMLAMYPGMHTIEEEQCVEIIGEQIGIRRIQKAFANG